MLPKVGVKRAAGVDRRREFSVSWAWMMLSFATMRSSVRSRLAPPYFQQLAEPAQAVPVVLCRCLCRNCLLHSDGVNPRAETDLHDTRAIKLKFCCIHTSR